MTTLTATKMPILQFAADLPGFPERRRFVLVGIAEDGTLFELRCLQDEDLRFVVVPAAPFVPGYAPEIDDEAASMLELDQAEDALLFLVVSVGERVQDSTVNLMAPVVVNQRTLAAAQVVLAGAGYSMRHPLRSDFDPAMVVPADQTA